MKTLKQMMSEVKLSRSERIQALKFINNRLSELDSVADDNQRLIENFIIDAIDGENDNLEGELTTKVNKASTKLSQAITKYMLDIQPVLKKV